MSDRTKLMLVSLAVMILPYRIDIPVIFLFVTAIICTALDMAMERWARTKVSGNFMTAISLYRRMKYQVSGGIT